MRPTPAWLGALLLVVLATPAARAEKDVPFLAARVNDLAGMLPTAARDRIEQKLRGLETRTGAQVAVLTIDSLDGEALEAYSVRVAQTWKLGRKGVDNGALLLIAKQDRKMRIEVGYGLEAKLTDLVSRRILDERLRPAFRQGNFPAGIEAGVDAIVATIEGTPFPAAPVSGARGFTGSRPPLTFIIPLMGIFTVVVGVFSFIAVSARGSTGWLLYLFLTPFYAAFPTVAFPPYGGLVAAGSWLALYPLIRLWLNPGSPDFKKRHPGLAMLGAGSGHSGSGGGWSSGGGGGGGFSGGGGSFGGGGSSSSW